MQRIAYFDCSAGVTLEDMKNALQQVGLHGAFQKKFDAIYASPLPFHSSYSPSILKMLKNIPLQNTKTAPQMTADGLSFLKKVATHFGECPIHKIDKMGLTPTVRLFIGEGFPAIIMEANIDDMNPQFYDHVMEKLLQAGCVDVTLHPVQMKKNRPGILLQCMLPEDLKEIVADILLRETTTLGIRYYSVERRMLSRTLKTMQTCIGSVIVKIAKNADGSIEKWMPEYESCKKIAAKKKISLREVYEAVQTCKTKKRK